MCHQRVWGGGGKCVCAACGEGGGWSDVRGSEGGLVGRGGGKTVPKVGGWGVWWGERGGEGGVVGGAK